MSSSFAKIDSLPVRTRLLLLFAVVIAGLGVLVAMFLFDTRGVMLIEKEAKTRNVVEVAFGVLERYSSLEKTGTLTRDEAQKQAQEMLRGMRYDKAEYFWINDMQAKIVMHTAKPELDGKDMSTLKDPKGKLLFNEFVAVVKKDGAGFVDYYWPKPGENDPVPKISYVKGFTPWGWVIGSGIYIDDVDAQFRAEALRIAVVVAVILGLLVVLSTLISRGILRQLGGEPLRGRGHAGNLGGGSHASGQSERRRRKPARLAQGHAGKAGGDIPRYPWRLRTPVASFAGSGACRRGIQRGQPASGRGHVGHGGIRGTDDGQHQ
jgi:hypothetical protein